MTRNHALLPFLSVAVGIATFSMMDATMKSASIQAGVYNALLFRNLIASGLMLPAWMVSGGKRPTGKALKVHFLRSAVVTCMAPLFFWGLVRIPMAEAIAISFIAPLIALYFAAVLLGELIRPSAVIASLLGIAGVAVIGAARFGEGQLGQDSLLGIASILTSAVFYALNLVLQRRQAQLANPIEIAFFQNLIIALLFLAAAPWLAVWPSPAALRDIALGAGLATVALLFLSWGYARAEAQVLVPIEYTGFLWAALFGWIWFGETLNAGTVSGAALIVLGCWIAARKPSRQTAL